MRRAALLFVLGLTGCVAPPSQRLVWINLGGTGPCTVDLDRRRFILPSDELALAGEAKRLAATRAGALVGGADGLSFACYRTAMAVIDQARFRRVGFVSDFVPDD